VPPHPLETHSTADLAWGSTIPLCPYVYADNRQTSGHLKITCNRLNRSHLNSWWRVQIVVGFNEQLPQARTLFMRTGTVPIPHQTIE